MRQKKSRFGAINQQSREMRISELNHAIHVLRTEHNNLRTQLTAIYGQRDLLNEEIDQFDNIISDELSTEKEILEEELGELEDDGLDNEEEYERKQRRLREIENEIRDYREAIIEHNSSIASLNSQEANIILRMHEINEHIERIRNEIRRIS